MNAMNLEQSAIASKILTPPTNEEVTWKVAWAFWWGLTWRIALIGEAPSFLRGLYVGYHHVTSTPYDWPILISSYVFYVLGGAWIVRHVLTKGISGYKLVVRLKS